VRGGNGWVRALMSPAHACVLHESGKVSCWGSNEEDALGLAMPSIARRPPSPGPSETHRGASERAIAAWP
jgi:hypothetical protein